MNAIASVNVVRAVLLAAMLSLVATGCVTTHHYEPAQPGDRIVPPSEYVEDIETPGTTGGVEDEADAADAQAEEEEAKAKKAKDAESSN